MAVSPDMVATSDMAAMASCDQIDDNAANIASAARLGWQVHHFIGGAERLAADLRERGLIG